MPFFCMIRPNKDLAKALYKSFAKWKRYYNIHVCDNIIIIFLFGDVRVSRTQRPRRLLCRVDLWLVVDYTSGLSAGGLPTAMSADLATSASMTLSSCIWSARFLRSLPDEDGFWPPLGFMNGSSAASSSAHHWHVIRASSPTLTVWWTISSVRNDTANSMPGTVTPIISSHHVLFRSKRASTACESFCVSRNR